MSIVVREINGIRGFCIYSKGIPYTYIYTKQAIEMLGLTTIQNGYKKLRINRFGEHYAAVIEGILPEGISQSDCGLNVSNLHYAISQDYSDLSTTCGTQKMTRRPASSYDNIIPEFTLDRIIFAIANRLYNKTAEEFRLQLIWNIIPHFQQTATQDQISKVPILNQTSQFMYDNTDYTLITQQAYIVAKQILDMHINRLAVLLNDTMENVFKRVNVELNDLLKANDSYTLNENWKRYVYSLHKRIGNFDNRKLTLEDFKDSIIFNYHIYSEYISYLIYLIREEEAYLIRESNGQSITHKFIHRPNGDVDEYDTIESKDKNKKEAVTFLTMGEKSNYLDSGIHKNDFKNLFFKKQNKDDRNWIY